ncbi:MAG: hypothetical protein Tsb002_38370 [Wenzhouxiangellaceae bacterium]
MRSVWLWTMILLGALILSGCGKDEYEDLDDGRGAAELYERAKGSLNARNFGQAIVMYKSLQSRYPFGRHAEQAQLDLAYAYYRSNEPENVTATLDRFIRTYPSHPNVDYAYYLKGLTYYEQNIGFLQRIFPSRIADRDQSGARQAFDDFTELLRRHPDSRYAPDARQRMVFLRNNLADHEIAVASYYMRRKAYVAALSRAKYVLETYPKTPATGDALAMMVRAYKKLEMPDLMADAERVLTENYPDHPYITGVDPDRSFWDRIWVFD